MDPDDAVSLPGDFGREICQLLLEGALLLVIFWQVLVALRSKM